SCHWVCCNLFGLKCILRPIKLLPAVFEAGLTFSFNSRFELAFRLRGQSRSSCFPLARNTVFAESSLLACAEAYRLLVMSFHPSLAGDNCLTAVPSSTIAPASSACASSSESNLRRDRLHAVKGKLKASSCSPL